MRDEISSDVNDVASVLDAEIDGALGLLAEGLNQLMAIGDRGDLCALGPARLIDVAQRFEAHRNRLQAVDVLMVEAAGEERIDSYTCSRSLAVALSTALRISRATAKARVARANQLMPQNAFSMGVGTAELPKLAEAVRAGEVTPDQVQVIGVAMKSFRTNPQLSAEESGQAESILVEQAAGLGPDDLRTVAAKLDEVLLPDGALPRDSVAGARRGLVLGPERKDGTHSISGSLTRSAYARLSAVLGPLAAPRPDNDQIGRDERSSVQRMHDALEDAASRLLDSSGLPRSGGTPATVHITIDLDSLLEAIKELQEDREGGPVIAERAAGITSFGNRLSFTEIIRIAEQAKIIPVYTSATQGIVAYGSVRRCASEGQTQALIARDGGCSFPGCDAPPEWCERHHIIPWHLGGRTDLDNLTLVCGFHHREFDKRGWRVVMHQGIPIWIPPAWINPEQTPQRNARIRTGGMCAIDSAVVQALAASRGFGPEEPPGADGEQPLDPINDLADLLALHISAEEREEFFYDLDVLLDSYLGTSAPANRRLEPVA